MVRPLPRPSLHSAEYRNPREFRSQDMLVVGRGCSGLEIAADLVQGGAARVRLAVRMPPHRGDQGRALRPDAIIAATGFSTGLESLVGHLGVLDDTGLPQAVAGLHFLGYEPGVGVIGPRAHRATRDLCRQLAVDRS